MFDDDFLICKFLMKARDTFAFKNMRKYGCKKNNLNKKYQLIGDFGVHLILRILDQVD